MLTLRDHNVEDYATLRDMDTTDVGVLDEGDRACLDKLGEYLVAADAWQRFAIWLLHKHFEPATEEVFLERIIAAPRGTETTPVGRSSVPGSKPISMRFDPDIGPGVGPRVGIIGMEFADPAEFGATSSVSSDDEAVLAGIAERLRGHGKTVRFGVRLIRNPLGLSENEVLVETCDVVRRALHCSVGERDDVRPDNIVETSWHWKPSVSATGLKVKQYCMSQCSADASGSHYISGHTNIPDFSRDARKLLR